MEALRFGAACDEDMERAIRRERAAAEDLRVMESLTDGVFGRYEVFHASGRDGVRYRVELRSLVTDENTCSCPDFRKNGLGMCKHTEKVVSWVRENKETMRQHSSCGEIFMERKPFRACCRLGEDLPAPAVERLQACFGEDGGLLDTSLDGYAALLNVCREVAREWMGILRVSDEVLEHVKRLERRARLSATMETFKQRVLPTAGAWPFLSGRLLPYQVEGALHLAGKGRALLADEMGLGKTIQGMAGALALREAMDIRRVLVVAPASLKMEWKEQITTFCKASATMLPNMRMKTFGEYCGNPSFFTIANYEQVIPYWKEFNGVLHPDLVIFDEAQRMKNWETVSSRCMKRLVAPYVFVLTGTPLENRIEDFYSLAELVDPVLFGTFASFRRNYFLFNEYGRVSGLQHLDDFRKRAGRIFLRRRKADVEHDLPPHTTRTHYVKMTPKQHALHKSHLVVAAALAMKSRKTQLTDEEFQRMQMCLNTARMACDSCYIVDGNIRDAPKLDELEQILDNVFEEDPMRKVIVFSEWTRMLDLAKGRLEQKGIRYAVHTGELSAEERHGQVAKFREDPDCRILLGSESAGVGLNLQVASVVINLDLPWNPAKLDQRIARAWRKRQTHHVDVFNLVALDTIEQRMIGTLTYKKGLSELVLDGKGDVLDYEGINAKEHFIQQVLDYLDDELKRRVASGDSMSEAITRPDVPFQNDKEASDHSDFQSEQSSHLRPTVGVAFGSRKNIFNWFRRIWE